MLRAVLPVVALLALASPARATTILLPDGTASPQPYQSWVDAARVPTPAGNVLLRVGGCAELDSLACTELTDRTIDADPGWLRPQILLHELGHIFDHDMAPWARTAFAAV